MDTVGIGPFIDDKSDIILDDDDEMFISIFFAIVQFVQVIIGFHNFIYHGRCLCMRNRRTGHFIYISKGVFPSIQTKKYLRCICTRKLYQYYFIVIFMSDKADGPKKKQGVRSMALYNSEGENYGSSSPSINGKDLLMIALVRFYKQNGKNNIVRIIPIIEGESKISLRLIDWFVTNFSKKFNTIIPLDNKREYINVYVNYRQQLKAFSKHQFDPFRRRDRIKFFYDKDRSIETTVGQLNFFKWILQNGILDYIDRNIDIIEADMIVTQKNIASRKQDEKNNKKQATKQGNTIVPTEVSLQSLTKQNKNETKRRKIVEMNKSKIDSQNYVTSNKILGPKLVKFD